MSNSDLQAAVVVTSLAALFIFNLYFRLKQRGYDARYLLSQNWPTISATVVGGSVQSGGDQSQFFSEFSYSYQIEGQYYSGYYRRVFGDEQRAWDFVDGMKDKTVVVRYKRKKPEISVFRHKDQLSVGDTTRP